MKKMENTYRYRQIARVTFEITTPLAVGSGNKDITTDSVVMKDVNELPYIPGTTLAKKERRTGFSFNSLGSKNTFGRR